MSNVIFYNHRNGHSIKLNLSGFSLKHLSLGIWDYSPDNGKLERSFHYQFLDMEGSNEGANPTPIIECAR